MKRRLVCALMLSAVTVSACVTYEPVTLQLAPPTRTVRVSLNGDARAHSFGTLGSQIESIEGEVRSVSDSGITIAASEVAREGADEDRLTGETVLIPSRYVASVAQKRVQVGRSVLLAAAITAGAIWIGTSLGGGSVAYSKPPSQQSGQ